MIHTHWRVLLPLNSTIVVEFSGFYNMLSSSTLIFMGAEVIKYPEAYESYKHEYRTALTVLILCLIIMLLTPSQRPMSAQASINMHVYGCWKMGHRMGYLTKSTNRLSHYPHKTKHKRLVACIDLIMINLDRTLYDHLH